VNIDLRSPPRRAFVVLGPDLSDLGGNIAAMFTVTKI